MEIEDICKIIIITLSGIIFYLLVHYCCSEIRNKENLWKNINKNNLVQYKQCKKINNYYYCIKNKR